MFCLHHFFVFAIDHFGSDWVDVFGHSQISKGEAVSRHSNSLRRRERERTVGHLSPSNSTEEDERLFWLRVRAFYLSRMCAPNRHKSQGQDGAQGRLILKWMGLILTKIKNGLINLFQLSKLDLGVTKCATLKSKVVLGHSNKVLDLTSVTYHMNDLRENFLFVGKPLNKSKGGDCLQFILSHSKGFCAALPKGLEKYLKIVARQSLSINHQQQKLLRGPAFHGGSHPILFRPSSKIRLVRFGFRFK